MDVVSRFEVGFNKVRFGLVVYSNKATVVLKLKEEHTAEGVFKRIDSLPFMELYTNTSGGLYLANHVIFRRENGDRPHIKNIAILLTDGNANIDADLTEPYAKEAKSHGVKMIVIGVTDKVYRQELEEIASQPLKYTVFHLSKIEALSLALNTIVGETCHESGPRLYPSLPPGKTKRLDVVF